MLDKVTPEFFEKNTTFTLILQDQEKLALKVIEVKRLGEVTIPGDWGEPDTATTREQFSIIFRGPHEPRLPQAMYNLVTSENTRLDGLFLVPVAQDRQGMIYEAVFA